ncbi:MAG: hypothetical protein ACE5I5_02595 [Candidatus Heimdallarchaeota archaeon]
MTQYFKNQIRGYIVVIPTLQALSKDICRNCIGLSGAQIKMLKGLKKLTIDLEASEVSEEEKDKIISQIERLSKMAESLEMSDETTCQKTAGNCNIGPACLCLDGAGGLMKQIPEPK